MAPAPGAGSDAPTIVLGSPPPAAPMRRRILAALLALAGLAVAVWAGRYLVGRDPAEADRVPLAAAAAGMEDLQRELAVARRGSQITEEANAALRREIEGLEGEIAELQAEVAFYQRLLAAGSARRGLAVHSLELETTRAPGVHRFRLILTQNLARTRPVAGRWELTLIGLSGGRIEELGGEEISLAVYDGDKRFEFKYFQELQGSLRVPQDFAPETLRVDLLQDGEEDAVPQLFEWAELTAAGASETEEVQDVRPE